MRKRRNSYPAAQAQDTVPQPKGKGYVINVASYKNGVGYGKWTHIDGWSESVPRAGVTGQWLGELTLSEP